MEEGPGPPNRLPQEEAALLEAQQAAAAQQQQQQQQQQGDAQQDVHVPRAAEDLLSADIWLTVLSRLDWRTLLSVAATSTLLRDLVASDHLWRALLLVSLSRRRVAARRTKILRGWPDIWAILAHAAPHAAPAGGRSERRRASRLATSSEQLRGGSARRGRGGGPSA